MSRRLINYHTFRRLWFIILMIATARAHAGPTFADAVTNGIVTIPGLVEMSGIVASRNNANVLWTHNDSGNPAVVYAIDTKARLLGSYTLPGNTDNEDIAIGPGPVTNVIYLYVGDIGDNGVSRANIKIYQVPEPEIYAGQYTNPPANVAMKGMRTIVLTYPDGPHNAEAMFVDPIDGDLYILTKESTSQLFIAPKAQLDTNDAFSPTFVRTVNFQYPSAADISLSGNEIIVRRESFAELWTRSAGQSISNAFGGTPVTIPVTGVANGEPNGEDIGFDWYGSGYFTESEGSQQPLRYFARTSSDGPLEPQILVPAGSTWRYLDNGTDQGTAWREPIFNDSTWSNGVAQFGYGDGDEATVIGYGGNANNKFITTYFRKYFLVNDAPGITNLIVKMVVDDGSAVFINGSPAVYFNLTSNATYNTLAAAQAGGLEDTWFYFTVDPHFLTTGINCIAVEVHQTAANSSDVSFDAQLIAQRSSQTYEPFNYSPGTSLVLVTNAEGQYWSAAGTGSSNATVISGNLDVLGLQSSTGAMMQFGAVDGPSARYNLLNNVTNGTLYYSLAAKVVSLGALGTSGGMFGGFNNSRGTQGTTPSVVGTRLLARAVAGGNFNLGVAKNSSTNSDWVWANNVLSPGQTIFIVGSYTFNTNNSSDDVSKLWINPDLSSIGVEPPATITATSGSDISANQIASFVLLQRGVNNVNQPGTMLVDELRIGSTWGSVTPSGNIVPQVQATRAGSNIAFSWPAAAIDFILESTATLGGTNAWSAVSPAAIWNGHQFTVTNLIGSTKFYRLVGVQ